MSRVREVKVTSSYFVTPSGALYETREAAYEHLAAWLIVNRQTDDGERPWIGPPKLVARLARWLAWADSRESVVLVREVQYEHRAGECPTHGLVAFWRSRGTLERWQCSECRPRP